MKSLQIITGILILIAIILLILHFTIDIKSFWFSLPLALGIVLNLISGIIILKKKRKNK